MSRPVNKAIVLAGAAILLAVAGWWAYDRFFQTSAAPFSGPASTQPPDLVDRTADFGLTVPHRQGDERLTGLDETLGSGACAFDYDNDGWVDLFLVNGAGDTRYYGRRHWWQEAVGHRLLRNVNGQHFADVTDRAGVGHVSHGLGCVAADFDNDGRTDIFVTNAGANILFRNQGDGTFSDATTGSGLEGEGWHTAAAVADVDGGGRLDLYIGGFIDYEKGARTYEPGSQFRQDVAPFFNPALYPALPNHLYRNRGQLKFEDVTAAAGVADGDGRTLAALWADLNDDRQPDLLVLNAAGTGSTTGYLNRGNWRFEAMGLQARIESGLSYRGITAGDVDNDGRAEFVFTAAAGHQTALLFRESADKDAGPHFTDRARPWQVASERYAALSPWSPALADLNNDGWIDLVVTNGQVLPDPDSPHVPVGQPKQVWLNDGQSHLLEFKPPPLSPLLDRQSARGLVVADFNNDGNTDLYVAHNNDLGQLLINELRSPNRWLGVRLDDPDNAPQGVGASVTVTTGQGAQTRWVLKGTGFLSDSDARLHFGLGAATRADVSVRWPDGARSTWRDVPLDGYLTVSRRDGLKPGSTAVPALAASAIAAVDGDSPALRAQYLGGLAAVADTPGIDELLRDALADPDETVRAAVIDSIAAHPSAAGLRLLVRFLEDPSAAIAARAVDGVCSFEEEDTTRFLLRAFSHSDALVRRHTADCFTRYNRDFQDIKAVIQRKDLAAPYLAALLADADPLVRIAAARALGAAEEFRGVPPLIELLADADPTVQGEAVRALGLIRDRYALPALLKLAGQPDLPPPTWAQLFIALKRLDHAGLNDALRDFAAGAGAFARVPGQVRLATFLEVLETPEGVVLPRDRVQQLAGASFAASARSEAEAALYATIAGKSGIAAAAAAVTPLLDHRGAKARSAAYLARFTLDPAGRAALVTRALRDPDAAVRNAVLGRVAATDVVLPDTLLLDALGDERTALAAVNALRRVSAQPVLQILLGWLQEDSTRDDLRIATLAALRRAAYPLTLPDSLFRTASEGLRVAMLEYETRRLPTIYVSRVPPPFLQRYLQAGTPLLRQAVFAFLLTRDELWAKQEVLALLQGNESPELRQHVLTALPPGYFRDGGALLKIAADAGDPLRLEALRRLQGIDDISTIQGLKAMARDMQEDARARVLAAVALPDADRKEVLPGLVGG